MSRLKWLLVVLLTGACSDGGTGPSAEPAVFEADRTAYQVHQVGVLTLNGSAPEPGVAVTGRFGDAPVTLMRSSDSTVVFMAPSATGTQTLEFTVAGREYSGTITVRAAQPVANPIEYLEWVASDAAMRIDEAEQQILADGTAEQNALPLELLQIARDSLASFESSLPGLTPDDAQAVANALSVNLASMQASAQRLAAAGIAHVVVQGSIPEVCAQKATALEKYQCTWSEFIDAMAGATIALGGTAVSVMALGPGGFLVGVGLAAYFATDIAKACDLGLELVAIHGMIAAEIGKSMGQAVWDKTGAPVWEAGSEYFRTHVYNADGFSLAGAMAPPASMTSFTDGGAVSFSFAPQLRPVRGADRGLGVTWLGRGLALLQGYNEAVARFGTKFQLPFAEPATSYAADVPHDQISIEVIENSAVRVSSVTGTDSRIDVTFETDAAADQEFTYDVIYNSGVYPELRVRYEATLRMPVFALGSHADTTLLGDTITMYGRVRNFYHLMHDDGTLVSNQFIDIGTGTSTVLPPHVYYVLSGNGGNNVYMEGWLTDPTIVADTFDIKGIINRTENALNLTVIMHDSAGVYGTSLLGEWMYRLYWVSDGYHRQTQRVRYAPDGTATVLSTTYYYSDGTSDTDYTQQTSNWRIRVDIVDGRPVHSLQHYGDYWASGKMPISYPVASWGGVDDGTRWAYTRQ